jgi:hypothetical protein
MGPSRIRKVLIGVLLGALTMPPSSIAEENEASKGKCLTPFIINARITPLENVDLQRRVILGRPSTEVSILSPSGKYRIHYDTSSGSLNLPAMVDGNGNRIPLSYSHYVDTVACIFDSVWAAEITTFSFEPPPADSGGGGGNEYDVYIQDLGANNFGYTQSEASLVDPPEKPNPRCPSYIVIDNDFGSGFRTMGVPAVCVTAAHEFFHAIQIGGYGFWNLEEFYFYEMTAESMESVVFPSVKDYVKDIPNYFGKIETIPLYANIGFPGHEGEFPGYERAIWGIFLIQQYGIQFMRSIWERIELDRPFSAMVNAFTLKSLPLEQAFSTFSMWNFYTGARADTNQYYRDGKLFPPLRMSPLQNITSTAFTFEQTAKSYTMQVLPATRNSDTVYYIITNVDTKDALSAMHQAFTYALDVSPQLVPGWSALPNGMSYRFTVDDARNWSIVPVQSIGFFSSAETVPFPNPFNPKRSLLNFPVPRGTTSNATLYVLSSSMELIAEVNPAIVPIVGKQCYQWNGKNSRGELVPSGIYFYVLKAEGLDVKGKIAVVQ